MEFLFLSFPLQINLQVEATSLTLFAGDKDCLRRLRSLLCAFGGRHCPSRATQFRDWSIIIITLMRLDIRSAIIGSCIGFETKAQLSANKLESNGFNLRAEALQTLWIAYHPAGGGGGGEGSPLYGLYRYVRPQRVGFFSRFGHKYRVSMAPFWS